MRLANAVLLLLRSAGVNPAEQFGVKVVVGPVVKVVSVVKVYGSRNPARKATG